MNVNRATRIKAATVVAALAITLLAAPAYAGTPPAGSNPAGGLLGDFDGTGNALSDLLAISPAGNLLLYLNSGDGPRDYFDTPPISIGSGWTGYTLDAVTDELGGNGEGIVATAPNGNLMLYREMSYTAGTYTFEPITIGTGWSGMRVVGVEDLYESGAAGILAIDPQGNLRYYPNSISDGAGFGGYQIVGAGFTGYTVDLAPNYWGLVAGDPHGTLWYYPTIVGGTGQGTFGGRTQIGSGWNGYKAMDVGAVSTSISTDLVAIDGHGNLVLFPDVYSIGQLTDVPTFLSPAFIGEGWTGFRID
jgi:hypothetical protein